MMPAMHQQLVAASVEQDAAFPSGGQELGSPKRLGEADVVDAGMTCLYRPLRRGPIKCTEELRLVEGVLKRGW